MLEMIRCTWIRRAHPWCWMNLQANTCFSLVPKSPKVFTLALVWGTAGGRGGGCCQGKYGLKVSNNDSYNHTLLAVQWKKPTSRNNAIYNKISKYATMCDYITPPRLWKLHPPEDAWIIVQQLGLSRADKIREGARWEGGGGRTRALYKSPHLYL